tara:strand:+ start:2124 stop:3053 length:930 start_codon:yes stop_codon:yes gene_type:complete
MIKKIFIGIFVFLSIINFKIVNSEIFIKAKVNNQIITNFDIKNEKNYLLALNPNLRNLPDENINRYAIDSVINEKIKKIEIEKKYEIIENKNVIEKVIQDLYSEIGISNIEEFKVYLSKHNVNLSTVKKKIAIEVAWNDYIVQKFNNAVLVDEAKIKDKINRLSEKNYIDNILLSEIIFTLNESENFEKKLEKIEKSINQIGFEETAKIYSVSESKKNGGKIGWVYKSQLSNKISKQIENIKVGEFTEPMTVPGGFIILKLVDKKNQLIEINEEEEFKKAVSFEKNRQLTMYSTLHYKRIYNKAVINEF